MELLSMLMNAKITDMDGDEIGEVIGVHIAMGKLNITMNVELDDEEEEDPDDGAKDDIPEEDASKQEFPRLAAMGKNSKKKDGTNG